MKLLLAYMNPKKESMKHVKKAVLLEMKTSSRSSRTPKMREHNLYLANVEEESIKIGHSSKLKRK